jgi:hypothetical protein
MMDITNKGVLLGGSVVVMTTNNRGFTPEEVAERALDKIIYVGGNSHEYIREQAEAFRENIRQILIFYMNEAIKSDRTTIAARLREAGHPELVKLLQD